LIDDIADRLKELLIEKAQELKAEIHAMEVMPDHVHLFVESDPTLPVLHRGSTQVLYLSRDPRRV